MIRMPGKSYSGPFKPLTSEEQAYELALRRDLEILANDIGERNLTIYPRLSRAAEFLENSLGEAGYEVRRQGFQVGGKECVNLEVEITGTEKPEEIIVVGAHYDTVPGSPGANDNGTGVVAVLALARAFAEAEIARTLRFVAFVNEEPPYFQTAQMGSLVYAKECREQDENIVAMFSLETIGYYSDEENSQDYPFPLSLFYPTTGNFIGFVGNLASRGLVRDGVGSFRKQVEFPCEGAAVPGGIPGVGWSDHWAFWHEGYPAVMVTDTAPFRYPYYHTAEDTIDKIRFDRLARVVRGLEKVLRDLKGYN